MKYIDLIERFWQLNSNTSLGSASIAFYMYLLEHYKSNNHNDFTIADVTVKKELKITVNTIKSTRDKLRNIGLINYKCKNGVPCQYKILDNPLLEVVNKPVKVFPTSIINEEKPIKIPVAESKDDKRPVPKEPINNPNIPSIEEFLEFAKTLKNYSPELNSKIEGKYDSWIENNWKNGYDRPITNWKSTLKSTLPYLIQAPKNTMNPKEIPTINRPKSTYNE